MFKARCRIALLALFAASTGALQAQTAPAPGASAPPRRAADASVVRALQDHVWTLQAASDGAGRPIDALLVPQHPFVLRFDGPRLGASGGCNLLSGNWRLSPRNELRVGRVAATMKACEPPLMAADRALAALLAQPLRVSVERGQAPILQLVAPDQEVLRLVGERTPQSLYGAPTRIFLEVAAQRVACTPALQPATTCLQVRELHFDAKGLRVGDAGPWQAFYSPIEGYTHEPGVSNVLRINRYRRPQAPADGSIYLYVLDLVVESKAVGQK